MEDSGRSLAVGTQGFEERRTVTRGDPGEDGQMKLQCAFPGVEYPSEVMAHHARNLFNGDLGHQVEVDLWTDLGQARRQNLGALIGRVVREIVRQSRIGEVCEAAEITQRLVSKASPDHAGLDVRVESHRYGRLDTAADYDELIDEGVCRSAPGMYLLTELLFLCRRHGLDDEHLEVRLARMIMDASHDQVIGVVAVLAVGDVVERPGPVGLSDKRTIDPSHHPCQPLPGSASRQLLDHTEGSMAWKGPKLLQRRQRGALRMHCIGHVLVDRFATSHRGDDPPGCFLQP